MSGAPTPKDYTMQTSNNIRQAWRTRTLLEEMRRETADAIRALLVGARPMPGIPLPRPCDVQPGDFLQVMQARADALVFENVKQACGYDPRFLLPPGQKRLELPAHTFGPVEAVAKPTRVIKLQAPDPMPVQAAAILLLPPARRETVVIDLTAARLGRYTMKAA